MYRRSRLKALPDPRVVERLEGQPASHSPVPDHRHHLPLFALEPLAFGNAQGGAYAGGRVPGTERVVFALIPAGEAGQPARLPQSGERLSPSGEQLVSVGLVAHIPDDGIHRRLEHIVQGHGQLHHHQGGSQVTSGRAHHLDDALADLPAQLVKLVFGEFSQIQGGINLIQQRHAAVS